MEPIHVPTLPITTFRLPPQLEGLRRLAYNLWWTWHPAAKELFSRVDSTAWQRYRSPIAVLSGSIAWDELLADPHFMAEYRDVMAHFDEYMANGSDHWLERKHPDELSGPIAYFCAEYGFDESLGIYSGGLGILAGDHTKQASDMALPFVAVGLLYRKGYFRQTIDADGHQEHAYPDYDLQRLPLQRVVDVEGQPLHVQVELPGRNVHVAVYLAQVGRVPVLLLDTDQPENDRSDRPITNILYVRGREMRLHQELVLGVGGVRALRRLGIEPAVWHLNEGHSAFLLCERAREAVAKGAILDEAWDASARTACSRSTPRSRPATSASTRSWCVASPARSSRVMGARTPAACPSTGSSSSAADADGSSSQFDMTAFSLRLTRVANAVSHLHADTANATWHGISPGPILGITNGVHVPSWVGDSVRELLERQAGADLDNLDRGLNRISERVERVSRNEVWEAHQRQKLELTLFAQGRLRSQFARLGESPSTLKELEHVLDPSTRTTSRRTAAEGNRNTYCCAHVRRDRGRACKVSCPRGCPQSRQPGRPARKAGRRKTATRARSPSSTRRTRKTRTRKPGRSRTSKELLTRSGDGDARAFCPGRPEVLRLAARCQHVRRSKKYYPRADYAMDDRLSRDGASD